MARKSKPEKIDGLSPDDIKKIRAAIRQVWSWSYPRRLCVSRATHSDGFPRCEQCKEKVPKIYPDHITPVGDVDAGFISRLFCPSSELQALCKKCHGDKTRTERRAIKSNQTHAFDLSSALDTKSDLGTERDDVTKRNGK